MISASWQELPLEKVAEIHDNLREPVNAGERASRHGPYPYYGATGQVGWIDNFRQDGEYVLLGEDGAPFLDITKDKAYLVSGKCWVNNHAHVLRGKEGVCINKFLLYALNGVNYHGYANGTTRLKLTQAAMRKLPIKLPSVDVQTQVVSKIDELFSDLDAGVAALKRAQANLKRYRAAVLKAAVEGRLTAQWREERKAKGIATEPAAKLLERILAERRKKWEAAQLKKYADAGKAPPKGWQGKYFEPAAPDTNGSSELPKDWCSVSLNHLVVQGPQNGLYLPNSAYGSGMPIMRIDDYQNLWSRPASDLRKVNASDDDIATYALNERDLLVNRVNSLTHLGKVLRVGSQHIPAVFESNMMRMSVADCICVDFVAFYLKSEQGRRVLIKNAKNAVNQASINQQDVLGAPVPLPPVDEQIEIVSQVEAKLSSITQAETEIKRSLERAVRLRQAILKRAFEGRLV